MWKCNYRCNMWCTCKTPQYKLGNKVFISHQVYEDSGKLYIRFFYPDDVDDSSYIEMYMIRWDNTLQILWTWKFAADTEANNKMKDFLLNFAGDFGLPDWNWEGTITPEIYDAISKAYAEPTDENFNAILSLLEEYDFIDNENTLWVMVQEAWQNYDWSELCLDVVKRNWGWFQSIQKNIWGYLCNIFVDDYHIEDVTHYITILGVYLRPDNKLYEGLGVEIIWRYQEWWRSATNEIFIVDSVNTQRHGTFRNPILSKIAWGWDNPIIKPEWYIISMDNQALWFYGKHYPEDDIEKYWEFNSLVPVTYSSTNPEVASIDKYWYATSNSSWECEFIITDIWHWFEVRVPVKIALKSYEEIKQMGMREAYSELNTYPRVYFEKFNSEWHMRQTGGDIWYLEWTDYIYTVSSNSWWFDR